MFEGDFRIECFAILRIKRDDKLEKKLNEKCEVSEKKLQDLQFVLVAKAKF